MITHLGRERKSLSVGLTVKLQIAIRRDESLETEEGEKRRHMYVLGDIKDGTE